MTAMNLAGPLKHQLWSSVSCPGARPKCGGIDDALPCTGYGHAAGGPARRHDKLKPFIEDTAREVTRVRDSSASCAGILVLAMAG